MNIVKLVILFCDHCVLLCNMCKMFGIPPFLHLLLPLLLLLYLLLFLLLLFLFLPLLFFLLLLLRPLLLLLCKAGSPWMLWFWWWTSCSEKFSLVQSLSCFHTRIRILCLKDTTKKNVDKSTLNVFCCACSLTVSLSE